MLYHICCVCSLPSLQTIEKLLLPHGEGSPQVTWTCTIGLGVVERGLAETAPLKEAVPGQIAIWTTDPDYPHFQIEVFFLLIQLNLSKSRYHG